MSFWEWLGTPAGTELVHAIIGLLIAVTGMIAYHSHRVIAENSVKLDRHLEQHLVDSAAAEAQAERNLGSTKSQP